MRLFGFGARTRPKEPCLNVESMIGFRAEKTTWVKTRPALLKLALFGFVFGGSFYLYYNQAFHENLYISDLPGHLEYSRFLEAHPLSVPHPLFHVIVLITSWLSGLGINYSAAVALSGITTSLAAIIYWILKSCLGEEAVTPHHAQGHLKPGGPIRETYTDAELLFVVLLMMTVGSIFIPGPVKNMYLGRGVRTCGIPRHFWR